MVRTLSSRCKELKNKCGRKTARETNLRVQESRSRRSRFVHMNRDNEPTNPMTAENVEQFNVWIFDSSELVVSVIPIDAPWNCR